MVTRVLLTLVAVLIITVSASGLNGLNSGVVDDFESYADNEDLHNTGYRPDNPFETSTVDYVLNSDGSNTWMDVDMTMDATYSMLTKWQNTIQDVWGGPLSTHITFDIKGDATNGTGMGFQLMFSGAERNTSGYTLISNDFDFRNENWQTITVVPVTPGWDVGPGWWGLGFDPFGVTDGSSCKFSIDNVILVPEPATMLLVGLGGLFLRRKK